MNTHVNITTPALVYNGVAIRDRDEMLSLTDMWKAAGGDDSRKPSEWLRQEATKRFVEFLGDSIGVPEVGKNHFGLVSVSRGGVTRGETFAHWQIGLAYAKYLSPDFHMWCNEVVRAHMEGTKQVATLPPDVLELIRRDDGISRMLAHKVTGIESTVQTLAAAVAAIASVVRPPADGIYVTGRTAGEIWKAHGFPPIKVTCWFSNRLSKMGCEIGDGRRIPVGLSRAKLFDPDKADNWLRNGGRKLVEEYIAQRQGQGKLRLIGGRS